MRVLPASSRVILRRVVAGGTCFSAYPIDPGRPSKGFGDNMLWIITEYDRLITTLLLPDGYWALEGRLRAVLIPLAVARR